MSRFLNTPSSSQWSIPAGAGGGAAARRATKQRVAQAAAAASGGGGAVNLADFARSGSAASQLTGVGKKSEGKKAAEKRRRKRRQEEKRMGLALDQNGGGNTAGGADTAKRNSDIRMRAQARDLDGAFGCLQELLRAQLPLQDTTVAMLIKLCTSRANLPDRIKELTEAMHYSGTRLDVHAFLLSVGAISQLCASGDGMAGGAQQGVNALVEAIFGAPGKEGGLGQLLQLPSGDGIDPRAAEAARQHVLRTSRLLTLEFLEGALQSFSLVRVTSSCSDPA